MDDNPARQDGRGRRARQGRGVGRALGIEGVDWARASGYRGIQFNSVVETNLAAVLLRQSLG
jgi:GNAT superfamily N-acetyltransferase